MCAHLRLSVYANSLLVTLNSRRIVRDGISSKQATSISYTVPLSRIMPRSAQLERSMDGSPHTNSGTVEGQKVTNGNYPSTDAIDLDDLSRKRDLDRTADPVMPSDNEPGVLVTKHTHVEYTQ